MLWLIVGAIVIGSALVLLAVVAGLRRRLVELRRVANLARDRVAQAQRLQTRSTELQTRSAVLQTRSTALQARIGQLQRR